MKIAIVSFEFEGITKNGGIGTAFRALADALCEQGHEVTVLLYPFPNGQEEVRENLKLHRHAVRADIHILDDIPRYRRGNPGHVTRSMTVYEFLKSQHFDIVHLADNTGMGYHAVLAKHMGLDFLNTQFVVGTHGPCYWVREAGNEYPVDPEQISMSYYERKTIEYTDYVVSPSQYMIDFLKKSGWRFPEKTRVIPNINRIFDLKSPQTAKSNCEKDYGIIFFGRLEVRKGVFLFVEALKRLLVENFHLGNNEKLPVIFLGKDCPLGQKGMASEVIGKELEPYLDRLEIRFVGNMGSAESQAYIRRHPGFLVCMPSLIDNSPYVLVEAIENRLHFIASRSGGQAELIHSGDRRRFLFEPSPIQLANLIRERLFSESTFCRPSPLLVRANREWEKFHNEIRASLLSPAPKRRLSRPLVSVGFRNSRSEFASSEILGTIRQQKYPQMEIIVVGATGAGKGESFQDFIKKSKGAFLAFLDNSRLVSADSLGILVDALKKSGADLAVGITSDQSGQETCAVPFFEVPLGSLFWAGCGARFFLVRRTALLDVILKTGVDLDDVAGFSRFLNSASVLGKRIISVPRVTAEGKIFWYSDEANAHRFFRTLRLVETQLPANFQEFPSLMMGFFGMIQHIRRTEQEKRQRLLAAFENLESKEAELG